MRKFLAAMASTALLAAPLAAAPDNKPVELSGAALTAAQTRSYALPFTKAFPAAISTLQALGYLNINASKDAGTVTAETEAKGKVIYNIFWGFGKKKRTMLASILVEEVAPTETVVKLNLSMIEAKSRGIYGASFRDGKLVAFADPYQEFYAALDAEMARRAVSAAPTLVTVPVQR